MKYIQRYYDHLIKKIIISHNKKYYYGVVRHSN